MENYLHTRIIVTTVLVETSPQALPLGAACIVSALKANNFTNTELSTFSLEDAELKCTNEVSTSELVASEGVQQVLDNIQNVAEGNQNVTKKVPVEAVNFVAKKLLEAVFNEQNIQSQIDTDNSKVQAVICFSLYMWNRPLLEEVATLIKQEYPNIVLIAGGPEVTAHIDDDLLQDPVIQNASSKLFTSFDYLVSGEGELIVPKLILEVLQNPDTQTEKITNTKLETRHTNTCKKRYGEQVSPELVSSPYLDGTLNPTLYGGALWELARGCPFKCSYCYESKGTKKVVYFPLKRLEKELELFNKSGVGQVFVLDPTYNADKKRALDMLAKIKAKAPDIFFHFEIRAEYIDMAMAKAFASIPCSLQIGLQSANEEVLKLVHRTFNKKEFTRKIAILNEVGAVFGFDLIYGLPGDTFKGFCESLDYAISLYPNHLELFKLSVLPGTDLFDRRKELALESSSVPPYLIKSTPTFSVIDIAKAEELAQSVSIFYSLGRAVSWFLQVTIPLHIKPSVFFEKFTLFMVKNNINPQEIIQASKQKKIEEIQIAFIKQEYNKKGLNRMIPAVQDIIKMNGALSRIYADAEESVVECSYHPDDVLSEYALDLSFFVKNAGQQHCKVKVFNSKNGIDYKVI